MLERIPFDRIASLYQEKLGVDIAPFQNGVMEIALCQCCQTGYRFFNPPASMGSPDFYNTLYGKQDHADWAYQDQKWEYEVAGAYVNGATSVLDIGSGGGQFLASLAGKVVDRTGLETNPLGRNASVEFGLTIHDQAIEAHAKENPERYDAVTALQVLEHIYDVRSFLEGCHAVLKPGGTLVVAVPNNDSFIGSDRRLPLNMPPHHMGLWDRHSLTSVPPHFGFALQAVEFEPLQEKNVGWYQSSMEMRYLHRSNIIRSLYYRLGFHKSFFDFIKDNRHTIHGHTILAAYHKV